MIGAGAQGNPGGSGLAEEGGGVIWKCFLSFCSKDLDPSDLCLSSALLRFPFPPLRVRGLPPDSVPVGLDLGGLSGAPLEGHCCAALAIVADILKGPPFPEHCVYLPKIKKKGQPQSPEQSQCLRGAL